MKKLLLILILCGLFIKGYSQAVEEICYDTPISLIKGFDAGHQDEFQYWLGIAILNEAGAIVYEPVVGRWYNSPVCWGTPLVSKISKFSFTISGNIFDRPTGDALKKNLSLTLSEMLEGSGINLVDGQIYKIRAWATNPGGCWHVFGIQTFKFRKFEPGLIGKSTTICSGGEYTTENLLSAKGAPNDNLTYTWEYSNGNPIYQTNDPIITLKGLTSNVSIQRRVTTPNCPSKVTPPITISVYAPLTAGSITANQTICYNSTPNPIIGTIPTGGSGQYSYVWYSNDGNSYTALDGAFQPTFSPTALTKTTKYKRNVIDQCGEKESNEITITVNDPITEGTITEVPAIPYNTAPNLLICSSPSGGTGAYTYHWQILTGGVFVDITDPGLNSTSATFQPPALTVSTTYRRSATSGTCGTAYSSPVTINVYRSFNPGTIGSDYVGDGTVGGDQLVCNGKQPAQIIGTSPSGCVEGSYTYQWQSSNIPDVSGFSDIAGAQSTVFTPPSLPTVKYYRRKVFSGSCSPEYSNIIKVDVYAPLTEGTLSTAQTICNGSNATTLSVTNPSGVDGKYSYSWEYSELNNYSWSPVYGEYNSTLTPTNLTKTTFYRRVLNSVTCNTSKTSNEIKITVYDQIKEGTPSADQTIPYNGSPTALSCGLPTGGVGAYTYQWEWSSNNSDPWNTIVNATGTTYSPGSLTSPIYYRRVATSGGCGSAYSNAIHITILGQMQAGTIFRDQTICSGGANAETITGSEPSGGNGPGSYSYKWEKSTDLLSWAEIPGAIYNSLDPGVLTRTTYFHRIVTSGIAGSATSNNIKITVTSPLSPGTLNSVGGVCYNTTPGLLIASNPSGGTPSEYTYNWQISNDPYSFQDIQGATYSTYLAPKLQSPVYYRRAVSTTSCGTVYSNSILVNVDEQIIEGDISTDQNVCFGAAPTKISVTNPRGGNGSYQFSWEWSDDNYFFTNIDGATRAYYEPTAIQKTTYYRRVVKSNGCGPVYSETMKATVLPKIESGQIGDNQSICYNSAPTAIIGEEAKGGTGNFTYIWRKSTDNRTFSNILGSNSDAYQPGNLTETTYYLRVAKSDLCGSVESNVVTINVPGILKEGTPSANQHVCYNANPSKLTITSPTGGNNYYNYQWQSSGNNVDYTDVYGANDIDFSPTNITTDTFFRRVVTSGTCGSINSTAIKITVAKPLNAGNISSPQTICFGNTATALTGATPTGGIGAYSYVWENSIDGVVFQPITNAISTTYSPGQLSTSTYYQRIVTNGACGRDTSNIVEIKVLPKLTPGQITDNQSVCNGATPQQLEGSQPQGGDNTYSYVWQKSTDNSLFVNVNGTASNYTPDPVTANIYYRRQVLSANCSPVNSNSIYISVRPAIIPGTISRNQNICYNTSPESLNGPASSGGLNTYTYQWQDSISNRVWSNIPGETNLTFSPSVLTQPRYYRRVTTSGSCGSIPSNIITIHVYDKLDGGIIKGNQTICYRGMASILADSVSPKGGSGAYTYKWETSTDLNNWSIINNAVNNEYEPGIMDSTQFFHRIAINTCGSAISNFTAVNVLPKIDGGVIGDNQSICYNLKPSPLWGTEAIGANSNFTYQWEKTTDLNNWSIISNATNIDFSSDSLKTTTNFRRKAKSESCGSGYSNTIEIKVFSNVSPGSISAQQLICKDDTAKIIIGTRPSGGSGQYIYNWESSRNGVDWAGIIFNASELSYSPGVVSDTTFFRRKVSTVGCKDSYTNTSAIYVLKEVEQPQVNLKDGYCKNTQVTLSVNNVSSTNYAWFDATKKLINEGNFFTIPNFTTDQKYYVQALRNDGCKSETKELLLKLDNVKAEFISDNSEVILGGAIMFENKSTGATSYIWNFFEGDGSFEENPWHYYNIVGVKDIQLTAISSNDCRDTMIIKGAVNVIPINWENSFRSITSNPDLFEQNKFEVYPNPFSERLSIEKENTTTLIVTLVDRSGRVVISREISGMNRITLNTAHLSAGVYMLIINDSTSDLKTIKLIKQ